MRFFFLREEKRVFTKRKFANLLIAFVFLFALPKVTQTAKQEGKIWCYLENVFSLYFSPH